MKESECRNMLRDGWSKNGDRCVGFLTFFVKKTLDRKEKGKVFFKDSVKLSLLPSSPLGTTGKFN